VASDSEIRAWAHEHGIKVSSKGRVPEAVRGAHRAAHNGEPPPAADYPDGMTDDDFLAEADPPPFDEDMAETPPRPPAPKASSHLTRTNLRTRFQRGSKPAAKKAKAKPRVSTADLIGSGFRLAAKAARPLPPMYRVLRLESVVVGPLTDDAVKGTVVDTFLQPLARMAQRGDLFSALALAPAGIGAATVHLAQCAKAGTEPNPIILQGCEEVTRHGLMALMRVGGDAFAEQLAREREEEERYGGSVNAILEWLFSEPADPATEEGNIARMAARFAGQPDPETVDA
jgi:hypothetical protein